MEHLGLLVGLLTVLTVCIDAQVWDPFNCRRLNSQCRSGVGVCQVNDGTCDCAAANPPVSGFQGFDCNLQTNTIPGTCTIACENGGTCFNQGGVQACYCPQRFTGDNCEKMRVAVDVCNDTHIGMYFKPHHANLFTGQVVIIQQLFPNQELMLTDPACIGVKQPDGSFTILVPLFDNTDPCYPAQRVTNTSTGAIRYEYDVRVLYSGNVVTPTDETHTFLCEHGNRNIGGVIVGDQAVDLGGATVLGIHRPVSLTIYNRTGTTQGSPTGMGPVFIGQELFAKVSLGSTTTYTSIKVDNCAAYATQSLTGPSIVFFENGCPSQDALSVVDASVGALRVSPTDVNVAFFGIKFNQGSDLYITCNVTLCGATNPGSCDPTDCGPGTPNGAGRKKRQAADEGDAGSVTGHLIVVRSLDDLDMSRSAPTVLTEVRIIQESCLQSTAFMIIAPLLGFLLLVTLVISIIVCWRQSTRNRKASSKKFHVYDNPGMAKA